MSFTSVAAEVRERVLASRERFWRPDAFGDHSPDAVAQALSRLTRDGDLRRVRRGLYWRGTPTRLGMAPPPPDRLAREVAGRSRGTGPAGRSAALALGLSTQVPRHETIAVPARVPRSRPASPGQPRGQHQAAKRAAFSSRGRAAGSAARLGRPGRDLSSGGRQPDHRPRGFGVIRADRLARAAATEPPVVREGLRNLLGNVGRAEAAASVPRARSQSVRSKIDLAG